MNTVRLNNIENLEADVINNTELEVLEIKNSSIDLPADLGKMQNLKELHLIKNKIEKLPVELLDLDQTFVFCESNQPASIQQASVILFDLQRKVVSKEQAVVFFNLLNENFDRISESDLDIVIEALDYRIEEVRVAALKMIERFSASAETINDKSTVSVIGTPETFAVKDILHRMKKVSVAVQNKLTPKTTHIVICQQPALEGKKLELGKYDLLCEKLFMEWLDSADKQFLVEKNDENKGALDNVSSMIMSGVEEQFEMAMTLMQTHGVSFELLTDLFIFFNKKSDEKLKRKAKAFFKKKAPKEALTYFTENKSRYYGIMEGHVHRSDFYQFLAENPFIDRFKIARIFSHTNYLMQASCLEQRVEFIQNLMEEGTLIIDWDITDELKEALLEIGKINTLVFSHSSYNEQYEWISELDVETLDIYSTGIKPSNEFAKIKNLRSISLPQYYEGFPEVLTQLPKLECIELQQEQFAKIPDSFKNLTNLKKILMYVVSPFDTPISQEVMDEKRALLPEGCKIIEKSHRD